MSSCSTPPTAAGSLRATSGRSPCRSTSPSSSSAPIRTSWNSARPAAERRHTARHRSTPDPLPCKLQPLRYKGFLVVSWLPKKDLLCSCPPEDAPTPPQSGAFLLLLHVVSPNAVQLE